MKSNNDPFGLAVSDYFNGNKKIHIEVETDLTEGEKIPVSKLFRTYKGMSDLEKKALDYCNGNILDIGACAGAHSLVLQKQNKKVEALEISPLACEVMKQRGVQKVINEDIFSFKSQKYDTLLLLMNGIGICGTLEGLDKFLHHCKSILAPKGQIILDSTDILYMYEEEDGSYWIDLNGAYYGELQYAIKYKDNFSEFKWLYIDFETLESHAVELGYKARKIYENDDNNFLAILTLQQPSEN